ncbi:MAG: restriction endonuclease subunit S [Panacagrimonas sp.]
MPNLADVAEIGPGFDRALMRNPDELVSFVPMANVSEVSGSITSEDSRALSEVLKGFTPFQDRDLLVAKITPCFENGKIAHARIKTRFGFGSTEFHVVRPRADKLDDRYLFHFLRQPKIRESGERRMTGSGGQRRVPKAFLAELIIPLPPLPEQRRIAAILDKADALRAKRRQAIAKLDQLLQSVFLDMFGDPVTNPKGWPIRAIADLAAVLRDGPFGSNLKSEHYKPSGIRVIRLQNIGIWEFLADDAAYISEEHYASLPRNHCKAGDVLIGTLGDPNLRACILPPTIDRALNKADCLLFRPERTRATAEYICGLLNSPSLIGSAGGLALGQTRLRISMGRLKELSVPMPPPPEQQRFTSFPD